MLPNAGDELIQSWDGDRNSNSGAKNEGVAAKKIEQEAVSNQENRSANVLSISDNDFDFNLDNQEEEGDGLNITTGFTKPILQAGIKRKRRDVQRSASEDPAMHLNKQNEV